MKTSSISHPFFRFALATAIVASAATLALSPAAHAEKSYASWLARFDDNALSEQRGNAVAIDSKGDVCVVGSTRNGGNKKIYYVVKYSGATGAVLWAKTYDTGNGDCSANGVAFDSQDNVYVTGEAQNASGNYDIVTLKFDSAGTPKWSDIYNGPALGEDRGLKILVDANDYIYVGGISRFVNRANDIYVRKLNTAGTKQWDYSYDVAGHADDLLTGMIYDPVTDDVIICGEAKLTLGGVYSWMTARIDHTTGTATWVKNYTGSGSFGYGARGVTVDDLGTIYTVGIDERPDNTHNFMVRKYASDGTPGWNVSYASPSPDTKGPKAITMGANRNPIVTGTSTLNNFTVNIWTFQLDKSDGSIAWERRSPALDGDDASVKAITDGTSNTIVIGETSHVDRHDADYYIARIDGATGGVLWEQVYDGPRTSGGDDIPADVAVDAANNVIVTGTSRKQNGYDGIATVKFSRFIAFTGEPAPSTVVLPNGSTFFSAGPAALDNSGGLAARVVVKSGTKKYAAIYTELGGAAAALPAVETGPAANVNNAFYKKLMDPVVSPDGHYAFIGTMTGVPASAGTAVWTNLDGTLKPVLQTGAQVFGMNNGISLKSVLGITLRNNRLYALIKVTGKDAGVTTKNDLVLYTFTPGTGKAILRTDDAISPGNVNSNVKKISFLNPSPTSPGYGRWAADSSVIVSVTHTNGTAIYKVDTAATKTPLLFSGKDSSGLVMNSVWKSFGLPAIATSGSKFAFFGTLAKAKNMMSPLTPATDTFIVYSNDATTFPKFAGESDNSASTGGIYGALGEPAINAAGRIAFLGQVKNETSAGKVVLWSGLPGAIGKVARQGEKAVDANGTQVTAVWDKILNFALPDNASGPVFVAKIKGDGIDAKTATGIWAVDSQNKVRQILRAGDVLGDETVATITLLQSLPGSFATGRSYNAKGGITALLTFTDKNSAIVILPVP